MMSSFTDPLDKILAKVQSLFNSKKQIRTADMQEIQELAHSMKSSIIDALIPALQVQNNANPNVKTSANQAPTTPSYADITKRRFKQTTQLYVAPEHNVSPIHTENTVCSFLQKEKITAGIHSVRPTRNGGVVFNFDPKDDVSQIAKSIEANVGIKATAKTLSLPKITISRIPTSDSLTPASLKTEILHSNPWLQPLAVKGTFEVLFTYQPKDFISAVCKVSPDIRQGVIDAGNTLKVGVRVCPVRDRFHVPLCTNCSRFGHKASSCEQQTPSCCFCASNQHTHNTCPHKTDPTKHKCTNCDHSKNKHFQETSSQHNAFSKTCPSYLSQINKIIKQTNWGKGPQPST